MLMVQFLPGIIKKMIQEFIKQKMGCSFLDNYIPKFNKMFGYRFMSPAFVLKEDGQTDLHDGKKTRHYKITHNCFLGSCIALIRFTLVCKKLLRYL